MMRTRAVALTAGSLALAALVALGAAASVLNAQASPATPGPKATQTTSTGPAAAQGDYLPAEKAAIAAQEAKDQAENAAKDSDAAGRAKGAADQARVAAEAAAAIAAATPQTLQEYCQEGPLMVEPPPATHPADFTTTSGWMLLVGNECLAVYVGAAGYDNPNDGAVFIMHTRDTGNAPGKSGAAPALGVAGVRVLTVPGSGALTVQSVGQGGRLYVTSASGKTYTVLGQADQVKPGRA